MENTITVKSLTFVAMGRHNTQYIRPLTFSITPENVEEMAHGKALERMIDLAGRYLTEALPKVEREAPIPNGWEEERFSVVLEAVHRTLFGSTNIVLYGYTDARAVTDNGQLDPSTRIYFNRAVQSAPVTGNADRPDGRSSSAPQGITFVNMDFGVGEKLLTNLDILNEIQAASLGSEEVGVMFNAPETCPLRPIDSCECNMTLKVRTLLRAYAIPKHQPSHGQEKDHSFLAHEATGLVDHPGFTLQSVFGNDYSQLRNDGFLTLRDLQGMVPLDGVDVKVVPTPLASSLGTEWGGEGPEEMLAYLVTQNLPSIMTQLGFSSVAFTVQLSDALTPSVAITNSADIFEAPVDTRLGEFKREVVQRILLLYRTHDAESVGEVEVTAALHGDTRVTLRLNGHDEHVYIAPTFADGCYSQLRTTNMELWEKTLADISTLLADGVGLNKYRVKYR